MSDSLPFRFCPLTRYSYDIAVIDPAWPFETWSTKGKGKSASQHYSIMSMEEIKALPVRDLLKPNAVVLLWTTGQLVDQAANVMAAWQIKFKTQISWRKVTRNGKVRWGLGKWARSCSEPVLIGTVGRPKCFAMPSCFDGIAREHSRKPDEFYQMIVEKTSGLRRVDVFARERRDGWDVWGDEIDKFNNGIDADKKGNRPGIASVHGAAFRALTYPAWR